MVQSSFQDINANAFAVFTDLEILLLSISICKAQIKVKEITRTWGTNIACASNNKMSFADKNSINTVSKGLHLSD